MSDIATHSASLGSKRVLVIDPTQGMRDYMRQLLGELGINRVEFAKSAKEAVFQLSQEKDTIDAVFCELYLGGETDGQQLMERVRKKRTLPPSCAFFVVTSDPSYHSVAMAAEFSPDEILLKPVTQGLMRERVLRVFARKEAMWPVYKHQSVANPNWQAAANAAAALVKTPSFHYRLEACRILLESLLILHRNNEVLKVADSANEIKETSWALTSKARALVGLGRESEAVELLEHSIKNHPLFVAAYDILAETILAKDPARARNILNAAMQVAPSIHRQRMVARSDLLLNQKDSAEMHLQQIMDKNKFGFFKEVSDFTELAQIKLQKGDIKAAMQVSKSLFDQMNPTPHVMLAKSTIDANLAAKDNNDSEVQRQFGIAQKAMTSLETKGTPITPAMQLEMAKVCMLAGDTEQGERILKELISNNHENPEIIQSAKRAAETVGAKHLVDLVEQTRMELVDLNNTAVRLGATGTKENLAEAISLLDDASDRYPNNVAVHNNAAAARIMRCRVQGVTEEDLIQSALRLTKAYRIKPNNPRHAELSAAWQALAGRPWQPLDSPPQ